MDPALEIELRKDQCFKKDQKYLEAPPILRCNHEITPSRVNRSV